MLSICRCQDYILIDRGPFGTTELCGNSTSDDSVLELESRNFTVYFRTSEDTVARGFQMLIVCFNHEERNLEGISRLHQKLTYPSFLQVA